MIQMVPVLVVDAVWHHLREGMQEACRRGGGQFTEGWLHTLCRKGDAYLLADMEGNEVRAGIVCQEQNWSGRTVINVLAACGRDMAAWIEPAIAMFPGKSIVFEGRQGWQKTVPGVKLVRCVFEIPCAEPQ
jgi:hypothetical protein